MMNLRRLLLLLTLAPIPVRAKTGECIPSSNDLSSYVCFRSNTFFKSCTDSDDRCAEWAANRECEKNPGYMLENCQKSCDTCLDAHYGSTQVAPDHLDRVKKWLLDTKKYVEKLRVDRSCVNKDPLCTYYAVQGMCQNHEQSPFMQQNCAMACRSC